jgi:hypothetical protein
MSEVLDMPEVPAWQQDIIDALEKRRATIMGIDPASPAGDKTVVVIGKDAEFFFVDDMDFLLSTGDAHFADIDEGRRFFPITEGEQTITGTMTVHFENEEALRRLQNSKAATLPGEQPLYPNRKQRRIEEAKERRKPRGQRKRMILDIETYDPNRTKDWLR